MDNGRDSRVSATLLAAAITHNSALCFAGVSCGFRVSRCNLHCGFAAVLCLEALRDKLSAREQRVEDVENPCETMNTEVQCRDEQLKRADEEAVKHKGLLGSTIWKDYFL